MSLDGMAPASVDTSAKKTRRWLLHRLKESLAESRPSPKAAKNRSIKVFYPRSIVDTHYIPARLQSKWEPRHCVKTGPYDDLTMRDRMPPASVASCQIASFFWALECACPRLSRRKSAHGDAVGFALRVAKTPGTGIPGEYKYLLTIGQ